MSDFGELCPLFNTGVLNEITFPEIKMSGITASGNALWGTTNATHGAFTFGRTVVVTGAFLKRRSLNEASMVLYLKHYTSEAVLITGGPGTVFGTITICPTVSIWDLHSIVPFGNVTETTFTSTEILGLAPSLGTATSAGVYDLIVRYREK